MLGGGFAVGQIAGTIAQFDKAFLQVQRAGIVDFAADAEGLEVGHERVALFQTDDKLIVDMAALACVFGQGDGAVLFYGEPGLGKQRAVVVGVAAAGFGPGVEPGQLDAQHRGLQGIEPEIAPDGLVEILGLCAVTPQQFDPGPQRFVVGYHHAAIAERAEIFGREKAETAHIAHRARAPAHRFSADGLGRVFDDAQVVLCADCQNRIHVGTLAEKVYRQDGFGVGG